MAVSTRASIDDFLSQRRLAIIGVSRNPSDFSRTMFNEFKKRGYDVYAVNPKMEGENCVAAVADIEPPAEAALVMTPASASESAVRECAAAGIRRVWLYRAVGPGSVSEGAVKACEENGISLVQGECPYMFLEGAGWIHSFHGFCRKLLRTYPV